MSNNALHTLDWEAFSKLRSLTEIDLSHNRLEYLDERLFVKNKCLHKINLEGNKLDSLPYEALLINPFVSELNLKNAQLNSLQPQLFAGLTNLKRLDLSRNFLNNFNIEDFQHLEKLQELNLSDNFIKCNKVIGNKLKLLEERGIKVFLDQCSSKSEAEPKEENVKMFEKMIMAPYQKDEEKSSDLSKINQWHLPIDWEDESEEQNADDDDGDFDSKENHDNSRKNNEWLRFAPNAILCNKQNYILCQEYRSCLQDLNIAWHEQRKYKDECPDIKFAFVMGMAIGVSTIVLMLVCALCVKRCWENKKTGKQFELF